MSDLRHACNHRFCREATLLLSFTNDYIFSRFITFRQWVVCPLRKLYPRILGHHDCPLNPQVEEKVQHLNILRI